MSAVQNETQEWVKDETKPDTINATLAERGSRYGTFSGCAKVMQDLKDVVHAHPGWANLNPSQRESMEMICHKMGRILNGDPNYDDNWRDIAGYAELVNKQLNGENP